MRHFNRPTLPQPSSPRPAPSICILAKRSIPAQWLAVRWLGHVASVFVTELGHLHRIEAPETTLSGFVFSFPRRVLFGLNPHCFPLSFWGIRLRATNWEFKLYFKKYNSYDNKYIFKILQEHGQKLTVMSCWACQSSTSWSENNEPWSHMIAKDITPATNQLEMAFRKAPKKTHGIPQLQGAAIG